MGPSAANQHWDELLVKARARVSGIRLQGQSTTTSLYLCNAYAASQYPYDARFVDVPATVIKRYTQDTQRRTRAPWQDVSTGMLQNVSVLDQPAGVLDFCLEPTVAKCRATADISVFGAVEESRRGAGRPATPRLRS